MKFGSGYSTTLDSAQATIEAVEKATKDSGEPSLTFLFTTEFYDHNVVFQTVKKLVGDSKILGFCSGGIITLEGLITHGIAAFTLSGEKLELKHLFKKLGRMLVLLGKKQEKNCFLQELMVELFLFFQMVLQRIFLI